MKVLHIIGSSLDDYMFKVSWLYGKNCPLDILDSATAQFDYVFMVPPINQVHSDVDSKRAVSNESLYEDGDTVWYFVEGSSLDCANMLPLETINENMFLFTNTGISNSGVRRVRHPDLPEFITGPLTFGHLMTLIEKRSRYDLHLPQCVDFRGMTTMRHLFEDILRIPHPGPSGMTNFLSQNKALTRSILQNAPGVNIPKGEVIFKMQNARNGVIDRTCLENGEYITYQYPSLPLPFIVKPTKEDNSRGVSLCEKREDVLPALKLAFQYGDSIIVEEFIPGRELRAACIENKDGVAIVPSCKIEYFVNEAKIRRMEDKLIEKVENNDGGDGRDQYNICVEHDSQSHLALATGSRGYLIPGVVTKNIPSMSDETLTKIDRAVLCAHNALGCRDFSLFDFRVHQVTGEPYIIESCSYWTFTPLSVISNLLDRSKEFFTEGDEKAEGGDPNVRVGCWKKVAGEIWKRTSAKQSCDQQLKIEE